MTDVKVAASRAATKLELVKLKIENACEAPKLTDLKPSSLFGKVTKRLLR